MSHTLALSPDPVKPRRISREEKLAGLEIKPRDVKIFRAIYRHRWLTREHIVALTGGGPEGLKKRLQDLAARDYLATPRKRPVTAPMFYGLGREGARILEGRAQQLEFSGLAELDWKDRPGRPWNPFVVEHELGVATFFVALELAAKRLGYGLDWGGYSDTVRKKFWSPRAEQNRLSDGFFSLIRNPGDREATAKHFFLEYYEGGMDKHPIVEKLHDYFAFWQEENRARKRFPATSHGFRVLVVGKDEEYMKTLAGYARPICAVRSIVTTQIGAS
jgi:hypothetical protein